MNSKRDMMIELIRQDGVCAKLMYKGVDEVIDSVVDAVIDTVSEFVSDDDRVVGHWEHRNMRDGTPMERCDACGGLSQLMYDFCPWCGAEMYVGRG